MDTAEVNGTFYSLQRASSFRTGEFPRFDDVTADLVYVRLHGQDELYRGAYDAAALDTWAARVRAWSAGRAPTTDATIAPDDPAPERSAGREVVVYFDNDAEGHAPRDALALAGRLSARATQR